ncbi:hypothetical protein HYC85_028953 [Camellia sinensis]|uniref:Uncharacterized protein n=1 Tax=Camellia sinensis TaxID=4442 RepID=A0A7J7FWQ5_CAMSI|nr:hypothetical protein HYC85_028953 [Camellia sinensis]
MKRSSQGRKPALGALAKVRAKQSEGTSSASSSEPELEPSPVSSSDDSDSASDSSSSSSGTGARELLPTTECSVCSVSDAVRSVYRVLCRASDYKDIPVCCRRLGGQKSAGASPSSRHSSPTTDGCTQKKLAKVSDASIFCGISSKLR